MDKYIFKGQPQETRAFGPVPEGDYEFIVAECSKPYYKNEHWICAVKLIVQPSGLYVFANPWSGVDKNGDNRDGIGEFLLSCNRAPALGSEPDWKAVTGARGKVHLKVEIAELGSLAGKEVNRVSWFHVPHQLPDSPAAQPARPIELPTKPDLTREPDDIPF